MPSERRTKNPPLRGDEAELFRRHGDWLVRVTRLRLQCTQELAEDAAAHAWVQLCRTQPERTEKLPGWLRVVALYEGYNLLRKVGPSRCSRTPADRSARAGVEVSRSRSRRSLRHLWTSSWRSRHARRCARLP